MGKNVSCQFCGNELEKGTKVCPHCGSKVKKPFYKKWWVWLIVVLLALAGMSQNPEEKVEKTPPEQEVSTPQETPSQPSSTTTSTPSTTDSDTADQSATAGQKNALKSAQQYLGYSAFSHDGLIEQLEFEGFTAAQATYGVDNCGADWNEQAAKCAKTYLSMSSFSRQGLIDQLVFEGFTSAQAEYGVTQNGL